MDLGLRLELAFYGRGCHALGRPADQWGHTHVVEPLPAGTLYVSAIPNYAVDVDLDLYEFRTLRPSQGGKKPSN